VQILPLLVAAAVMLAIPTGCDGCSSKPDGEDPAPSAASPSNEGDDSPGDPGPVPEISVGARRAGPEGPGEWTPVIQNRGADLARLAKQVTVEREENGEWRGIATLSLRWSCEQAPEEGCVSLVPGAELQPPAWLGRGGEAQCACPDCEPMPSGRYRFVVRTCQGTHALPGEAFSWERP
jgi:hypothetical protein